MKTLVVYSGGLDSTCLIAKCIHDGDYVEALNFNYGSKHNVHERACAEHFCKERNITLHELDLDFIGKMFKSSLLKDGGKVPEGHYNDETMRSTVVPFRNGIMLSIAAGLAESRGLDTIAIANHTGDRVNYPDCRWEFVNAMKEAILEGTYERLRLYAPFTNMSKVEVLKCGVACGAPVNDTWSCYQPYRKDGRYVHCGCCGTDVERIEAFILAGMEDKTEYADKEFALKLLKEKGSI
jgi:7-cyano-7-deazaguanine synthase